MLLKVKFTKIIISTKSVRLLPFKSPGIVSDLTNSNSLGSNGGLQPVNVSANVIGHSGKQQERVSIFATPVSKAWNTIYKNTPVSGIISPSKTNAFTPITLNSLSKSKIQKTFDSSL